MAAAGYRRGLVNLNKGQISREIFVSDEIYREEQERLFARAWLFVGHESQIPNPGDFFVSGMGEESVILCRDRPTGQARGLKAHGWPGSNSSRRFITSCSRTRSRQSKPPRRCFPNGRWPRW